MGENGADGAKKDPEIKAERPVLDVINIKGAALFKGDVAAAGDLGETGETGLDGEQE